MKKLLYITFFTVVSCLAVTSCTDEEVKPQNGTAGQGGHPIDPKN